LADTLSDQFSFALIRVVGMRPGCPLAAISIGDTDDAICDSFALQVIFAALDVWLSAIYPYGV